MTPQMRLRKERFKNIQHRNIFDETLRYAIKTKFLTILAPGKMGMQGWDFLEECIPREDNTIVAANLAVILGHEFNRPYLEPDIWMVSDTRATRQIVEPDKVPWFPIALERFKGTKVFNLNVVEICWKHLHNPGPYYSFVSKAMMKGNDVAPKGYIIRAGGSITSGIVQFDNFFHEHPEPVTLVCGADMSKDNYARGKNPNKQHGEVWSSVHCLGRVIQDRMKRGSNIYTISDTKLIDHGYIEYYPDYLEWRDKKTDVVEKAIEALDTTSNTGDALATLLSGGGGCDANV